MKTALRPLLPGFEKIGDCPKRRPRLRLIRKELVAARVDCPKIFSKPLTALFLLLSLSAAWAEVLPKGSPLDVGLSPERLSRIDAVMKRHVDEKKVAGVVTLVARHGKVAHLGTYGMADVEAGRPMKADTIFRIASMTKPITSTAVMMLYEEGHFLLSDPISKFIPEFKNMRVLPPESSDDRTPLPAKRPITIRNLLTHTSGLTYQWNARLGAQYKKAGITHGLVQDPSTIGEKMKILAGIPLLYQPGEVYEYSLSIDVLGRLVEVVSGMTLEEFFQQRIFQPLGMQDTQFFLPAEKKARLAAVYERGEGGPIQRVGEGPMEGNGSLVYSVSYPYDGPRKYFSGGGGLLSTAPDYARFAQMMLNGGELNGTRFLSPKTVDLMTVDHVSKVDAPAGFGLGFSVLRGPEDLTELGSVERFGWGGFFYTTFFIDPEEDMIGVFMAQLHPTGGLRLSGQFAPLAYQAIVD